MKCHSDRGTCSSGENNLEELSGKRYHFREQFLWAIFWGEEYRSFCRKTGQTLSGYKVCESFDDA